MLVPNYIFDKLVNENGYITEEWMVAFSQLFTQLQTNFSNEGLVAPSQPSLLPNNFAIIQPQALPGTFLFDETNDAINIRLQDGEFHPLQIAGEAVLVIDGTAGDISANRVGQTVTLDLINTAVTSGTYTYPSEVTVDTKGRITFIESGSMGDGTVTSVAGDGTTITTSPNPITTSGTVSIASGYVGQTSITTVGTITTGTWTGSIVGPTYGGTGVNNGSNTLTITANSDINQDVRTTASPTFANVNITTTGAVQSTGTLNIQGATGTGTLNLIGGTSASYFNNIVNINSSGTPGETFNYGNLTVTTPLNTAGGPFIVVSNTTGALNVADCRLQRGDEANGYCRVNYYTGSSTTWSAGLRAGSNTYGIFNEIGSTQAMTIDTSYNFNLNGGTIGLNGNTTVTGNFVATGAGTVSLYASNSATTGTITLIGNESASGSGFVNMYGGSTPGGTITMSGGLSVTQANNVIDIGGSLNPNTVNIYGTINNATWNGGVIGLAYGGTNASLTASNGGIFYSTASAGAILSGTATANQALLSGASTTPAWSTATYPATTTINQLLYSSSANTITGLATANSSVLVTSSGGVPSLSTTIPAVTMGGGFGVNGSTILPSGGGGEAYYIGGFSSPTVGRIVIGDGTGWNFYMSKRSSSVTTDLFEFQDSGNFEALTGSITTGTNFILPNNGIVEGAGTLTVQAASSSSGTLDLYGNNAANTGQINMFGGGSATVANNTINLGSTSFHQTITTWGPIASNGNIVVNNGSVTANSTAGNGNWGQVFVSGRFDGNVTGAMLAMTNTSTTASSSVGIQFTGTNASGSAASANINGALNLSLIPSSGGAVLFGASGTNYASNFNVNGVADNTIWYEIVITGITTANTSYNASYPSGLTLAKIRNMSSILQVPGIPVLVCPHEFSTTFTYETAANNSNIYVFTGPSYSQAAATAYIWIQATA